MSTATVIPIRREFQVHRFDPIKHGVLSRHIALPWEDREEFEEILRGLLVEHAPQGPTAYYLVEDLAGVIWRKRRLLQAEGTAIREKLHAITRSYDHAKVGNCALVHKGEKLGSSIAELVAGQLPDHEDIARDLQAIGRALEILEGGKRGAYSRALNLLDEETLEAWDQEAVDRNDPDAHGYERDAAGLAEFLREMHDRLQNCLDDSRNAPLVLDQAHGMAVNIYDLERIAGIEAHLDVKLQRLLALLRQTRKP